MLFFLSTFNPPSFFFALICWQHWNEKYLSLQQQKKSTSNLWDIGTQGVWEMNHLRSASPLLWMALLIMHTTIRVWRHTCAVNKTPLHALAQVDSYIQLPPHTLWRQSQTAQARMPTQNHMNLQYRFSCTYIAYAYMNAFAHADTHSMHSAVCFPSAQMFSIVFQWRAQ